MPIDPKPAESNGQVLRGVCPVCGTITKRKDPTGAWVSRCPHPGPKYEGRMMPGARKSTPIIPASVDLGAPVVDPRHGVLEPVALDDAPRGMVEGPRREPPPKPSDFARPDPMTVDGRGLLGAIAEPARVLAGALADAQRHARELETSIARLSVEYGAAQDRILVLENEVARLAAEVDALRGDEEAPELDPEGQEDALADLRSEEEPESDPFEVLF